MSVGNQFDFEQQLLGCWHVVDDIQLTRRLLEASKMSNNDYDTVDNMLLGMEVKYQKLFEELFEHFETLISLKQL